MKGFAAVRVAAAAVVVCLVGGSVAYGASARPRVILITQEKGYVHAVADRVGGRASGVEEAFDRLARESGAFEVEAIRDVRLLTPRLKSARVVAFFTNGELPFGEGGLAALEGWVKQGGSILFLHPATDTMRSNPTWHNLIGGTYGGHPWDEGDAVTFKVHDAAHPACATFGETFTITDVVHQQNSFERNAVRELISVDMERTGKKRPVHVPVAWCRQYEKGRTFYTNLGHSAATWENPAFRGHLLGAIRWLIDGGEAKPNPEVAAREEEVVKRLSIAAPPALPQIGEGLSVRVFAQAPQFQSPASMCVSVDGRVFIGEDLYNTGDDRKVGNSRVKLLVDGDGDGVAEKVTDFATGVCSPQGMTFVGDTLFVVHAPFLSAFRDTNGDGVAEERRDLVTGFGPAPEGLVHHVPSGVHLGVDGFLYVTVGDKGIVKATGVDRRTVSLMGGGIVRVRPDGTEMELFCKGLRNPYSAAPDPRMNLFMRDNTNDGGGWNSRLSHMQRGAEYGYPSLYLHFGDEIVPAIADYGGGGATGSVFVSEPFLPRPYGRSLYTIDWGRSWVYRHNLAAAGATFKPDQEEFVFGSFPTAVDVDGRGRIYVANWGRLSWGNAPPIGSAHVIQATDWKAPPVPEMGDLSEEMLVGQLASGSATVRREAQWEILKRGRRSLGGRVLKVVRADLPLDSRVAALFTYAQLVGKEAIPVLAELVREPGLREHAIRALGDRPSLMGYVNAEIFAAAMGDADARVRAQAAIALGKSGRVDLARHLVIATADRDVMVRHAAQQSLQELNAVEACLAGLSGSSVEVTAGVLRTLRGMHDPRVVAALADFVPGASAGVKKEVLKTLQRLYAVEAPWDGSWWLTRPDTRGPNYKPARWDGSEVVGRLFVGLIGDADQEVAKAAIAAAAHVRAVEAAPALAGIVGGGGALKVDAVRGLIELRTANQDALAAMESVVTTVGWDEPLVHQAIDTLGALNNGAADAALVRVVGRLDAEEKPRPVVLEKAAGTLSRRPAGADLVPAVSQLLGAKHRAVRVAASLSLARSSEATAKERVTKVWEGNVEAEVEALLVALVSLPAEAIKPHAERVKALVKDGRPAVRHAALAARPKLGDHDQAAVALVAAAKSYRDRRPATKALAEIEPGKVADGEIVPATTLLAEVAASLANGADKDAYGKVLAAAQKYLADARVPRDKAAALLKDLKQSGVLAEYHRTDPIPTEAGKAFSAALPPEQAPAGPFGTFAVGGKAYEWKPVLVTDPAGVLAVEMPANSVVFLHTTYTTPTGGAAVLSAGSDDGVQVYLNGKKVLTADANRPTKADESRAVVQLRPGTNTVLVRVNNNAGAAGVQARLRQRPTDFEPAELEGLMKEIPADPKRGQTLFASLACANCHSIDPHAEAKGPYLGDASTKYQVPHLLESLLRPSAKIAQGFATAKVTTATGELTGWITKEGSDEITLRNAAGQSTVVAKSGISKRENLPQSTMPDGLFSASTLEDLASLLAYLSTLNAKP